MSDVLLNLLRSYCPNTNVIRCGQQFQVLSGICLHTGIGSLEVATQVQAFGDTEEAALRSFYDQVYCRIIRVFIGDAYYDTYFDGTPWTGDYPLIPCLD